MTKLKFKGRKEGERKQILICGREVKLNKKDYLDKNILTEKADIIKKKNQNQFLVSNAGKSITIYYYVLYLIICNL